MHILQQIIFIAITAFALFKVTKNFKQIIANIQKGKPENRSDQPAERFKNVILLAFGQKKMFKNWIPAVLHFFVYAGFLLINIEVLEILLDGVLGTHRVFLHPLGGVYKVAINFFEILALSVLVSCLIFFIRRNVLKINRLQHPDLAGFPRRDANYILIAEVVLMTALLVMNATDFAAQQIAGSHYAHYATGKLLVSGFIAPAFMGMSLSTLTAIERIAWWFHILGILAFLNYLPFSKHLHIIMAFFNSYYADLEPKGKIKNMPRITDEVKAIFDPQYQPQNPTADTAEKFGAKDIQDLSWKNLLDAYSCTECGRCTAACPANITGKLLSPRKIMMATRDRMEDINHFELKNGKDQTDGKSLLHNYISPEELKACTTCNACVEACPVSINPLSIIIELRRYLILEESNSPEEWNLMFGNIENNGAVWKFSPSDRANWAQQA